MELIAALLPVVFLLWRPEDLYPLQETTWP